MNDPASVLGWMRAREESMAALLDELVRAESPSLVPGSERAGLDVLSGLLSSLGYRTRLVNGGGPNHLLAHPPGRRRRGRQLLLGHVDTVWPLGTADGMQARQNGRFYGPGAYDMKGGLVQLVFALTALHELALEPKLTPVVFVNSDEEVGSAHSARYIRLLARGAARAFVLEPPAGPAGMLKTARKGVERFEIVVTGRAAHAGTNPEEGASAILELSRLVEQLFGLNDPDRGVTVNVGTIDGGLRANVVAPQASTSACRSSSTAAGAAPLSA